MKKTDKLGKEQNKRGNTTNYPMDPHIVFCHRALPTTKGARPKIRKNVACKGGGAYMASFSF